MGAVLPAEEFVFLSIQICNLHTATYSSAIWKGSRPDFPLQQLKPNAKYAKFQSSTSDENTWHLISRAVTNRLSNPAFLPLHHSIQHHSTACHGYASTSRRTGPGKGMYTIYFLFFNGVLHQYER